MDVLQKALSELWTAVAEMSPYLLFGLAVAGILSVLVSPAFVYAVYGKYLYGRSTARPVPRA